jgi:internalin A
LTELSCPSSSITTLGGIEVATNLTSLRLGTNRINDLAPIAGLTALKQLILDANAVTDLSALRNLHSLELLHLTGNSLTSLEPLSQLTQLTDLRLSDNQLRDLSGLESLTRVSTLYLTGNQISDLTPLSGATSLVDLRAWNNQISDLTPLTPLASLRYLHLSQNEISDITPLSSLGNLTDLRLSDNEVADLSPVATLTGLSYLMIDDNLISDLRPVQGLTRLRWFSLADNSVTDLSPLTNLTQLRNLQAERNQVVDVTPLATLSRLEDIRMAHNLIADLSPLASLTSLKWLGLGYNRVEDVTSLADLAQLKRLELNYNEVKDVTPLASLTNLETLYLEANSLSDIAAITSLPLLKWFTFNNQQVIGEPVTAGSVTPNPIRQFTSSYVTPTESALCVSLSCESLVYPNVGAAVVLDWSEHVIIGSGHATFSGRLSREVRAAQPSREDLMMSLSLQTAHYEMGTQRPSNTEEWLEVFNGSHVSTDPTATLEPVSADTSLLNTDELGEYPVTFTVRDSLGRQTSTTGRVVVRDTTAPALSVKTPRFVVEPGAFAPTKATDWISAFGISASDAGSGVRSEGGITLTEMPQDLSVPGSHTITIRAIDNAGNTEEASAQLVVKNFNAPALSLGHRRVVHEMGDTVPSSAKEWVKLFRAEATSQYTKQQLPIRVHTNGVDFSTSSAASYNVVFTTTDLSGVSTTTTGELIVTDTTSPQLKLKQHRLTLPQTAFEKSWSPEDWLEAFGVSATDGSGTGLNPNSWLVDHPKQLAPGKEHQVQFSVSDHAGNRSQQASATLMLQAAPTAEPASYRIAQDSEMVLDPNGAATTTGTLESLQPQQVAAPSAGGRAWIEAERLAYAPTPGFVGREDMEVRVTDNLGQYTTVQYSFEVVARPAPAKNLSLAYTSTIGQPATIKHADVLSQIAGSQLRVVGVSTEKGFRGDVEMQDQQLVFTPDGSSWAGQQSFLVTVQDDVDQTTQVPVQLTVAAPESVATVGTTSSGVVAGQLNTGNRAVDIAQNLKQDSKLSSSDLETRDSSGTKTVLISQAERTHPVNDPMPEKQWFANVAPWLLTASIATTSLVLMLRAVRKRQLFK